MNSTLLIDADTFIYAAAIHAEDAYEWDDDIVTVSADLSKARAHFADSIDRVVGETKMKNFLVCLSDSAPCFRKTFYPGYKAKRGKRPMVYTALREWVLEQNWRTYLRPALEADDILGILATHKSIIPGDKVIWSQDKDLLTVPGLHWDHEKDQTRIQDEHSAERFFLTQVLTGDTVDCYPGCPGIGPKKAAVILDPATDKAPKDPELSYLEWAWGRIVQAYEKANLTEAHAITQARCARILQASDYNFKTKEPILWNPSAASTVASAPLSPASRWQKPLPTHSVGAS